MNISEDQKRWLVIGIAFNKLVPYIRPFVEQSLQAEYQKLQSIHNIHSQTLPGMILKKHPKHLKYENINGNSSHKLSPMKFDISKFDYKVTSHVDLAKLYVQPFMAKFSAFDGKCDGSAVLLLLGEVPVFSNATQSSAKTVKEHVRNEWAHCNFTDWDEVKFQSCFQEMRQLVQSLSLPAADETTLLSELNDWETKGTAFCGNSPVDPALLSLVHNEVLQLSSDLEHFVCQFKEQNDVLKSQVLGVKQNLEELVELPQKFEQIEHEMENLKQKMADFSCSAVKRQQSVNPPSFFGALDRNEYFTGRKKELESLDKAFHEVNTTRNVLGVGKRKAKVHGICGLGGCGKSSLAFEYAWRNLERYPGGVFVLNGESDNLLRASLQGVHGQFVHKTQSNQHEEAKQAEQMLTDTLSWLGNLRHKWLLLVDNMDQKELSSYTRKIFFGQWKNKTSGDILVTSRRSSQALCEDLDLRPENCVELDAFPIDESTEFLQKRRGLPICSEDQEQKVAELAQELGGLPLALEQAAAYINTLQCSIQSYLEQYREQKSILLNRKSAKPCSEIYSEARLAVQTTWLLNFSYIENDEKDEGLGKAAAFFMKIATYLSPDEIPIDILNVGAPEIDHEYLKNRLKMPIGAEQIIDLLVRFSLFKRKSNGSLSIHRLVQETLKERYDGEGQTDEIFSSAIRMLHRAFLDCVGGTDFLRDLHAIMDSLKGNKGNVMDQIHQSIISIDEAKLEVPRWIKLSLNTFAILRNLLRNPFLKPDYLREETARLFCEAAFFSYSLGLDSEEYCLQQWVLDILCAVKEPIRFYKDDELMKVTRILLPITDPDILSRKLKKLVQNVNDGTGVPIDTNQTNELLGGIEVIRPKAEEAFAWGDFQTCSELYTEIVKLSCALNQPQFLPLGKTFCNRGIANLKLENIEAAVDDFSASIRIDSEHYRGYYWKAYALCKLVENGRTDFTSRAQAAAAVLHFKFAHSKPDDIQKLQHKFQNVPGLLDTIKYKFVTHVSQLEELESELFGQRISNDSLTVILADGKYDIKEMVILEGCYNFVCLPGSSAMLRCNKGLYLSNGSFLFENVQFENPSRSVGNQPLSFAAAGCTAQNEMLPSITLERLHPTKEEFTTKNERKLSALIEADDVNSLVMDDCLIASSSRSGIMVKAHQRERTIVSVRSSVIRLCGGPGLELQGGTTNCHMSIRNSYIHNNIYGIVINSPSRFYLEKNRIFDNSLSGIVASGGCYGGLLRNSLFRNTRHGILLKRSNASIEENFISKHCGWGIVCCFRSNLTCKQTLLENNYCGGLRIMFNSIGYVLVENCEFRRNIGPDVFPSNSKEICPLELKWKQLFTRPRDFPIVFYLSNFLELTNEEMYEYTDDFKCPVLRNNRVSDVPHEFLYRPRVCYGCWEDLRLDSGLIECPRCRVARYCSEQCFDSAKAVHLFVCNSILEANKECEPLRLLTNPQVKKSHLHQSETGLSLCVIAAVNVSAPDLSELSNTNDLLKVWFYVCLLTCPQRNLYTVLHSSDIHEFIMVHGSHVQESMMDIKTASILANFDPESETVTVYRHRVFSLDKVPDAWNWVNRSLDLFAKSYLKEARPKKSRRKEKV